MRTDPEDRPRLEVAALPEFPARAATAASVVPLLPIGAFLAFGGWNAPPVAYAAVDSIVLTALCLCGPEILSFPVNTRGELEHQLALARCAGTSWFPDMRAQGRRTLLTVSGLCFRAAQQRSQWTAVFAMAALLYLALCVGIAVGAATGWLEASGALWSGVTSALACAYLFYLAARYRGFGAVGPGEERLLEAANLHQLCDQERRAELISLVKKG